MHYLSGENRKSLKFIINYSTKFDPPPPSKRGPTLNDPCTSPPPQQASALAALAKETNLRP